MLLYQGPAPQKLVTTTHHEPPSLRIEDLLIHVRQLGSPQTSDQVIGAQRKHFAMVTSTCTVVRGVSVDMKIGP